jgi:anti-sigma factor RsiW
MDCTTFLDNFSDWIDGDLEPETRDRMNAHVAACVDCQQYEAVYARGTMLLRGLDDDFDLDEDVFRASLEHRILRARRDAGTAAALGSGAPVVSLLAMTVVVLSVAWIPVLMTQGGPAVVDLDPIAATAPEVRTVQVRPIAIPLPRPVQIRMSADLIDPPASFPLDLREDFAAPELLRRYAPVLQPYRAVRSGID